MKAKVIFSLIVLMNLEFVHSQFSATGGTSLFNNFGTGRNLFGLDLGLEYNQDENESIWGRISFYPSIKNSRIDSLFLEPYDINKFSKTAYVQTRTGFLQLSGGSRYHAGDGYDMGIGLFGGYKFSLILINVKNELDEYDETVYKDPQNFSEKSKVITLTVGVNGGVKYTIPNAGTIYLEGGVDYGLLGQASNASFRFSELYNVPLFFSLNLGFRKAINF